MQYNQTLIHKLETRIQQLEQANRELKQCLAEQKLAEDTLRESEQKFTAAFLVSPNLMAITRLSDGTILEVNEGYSRLLGYSRAESIGKTTSELSIWVDPVDRVTFATTLKESGRITDFETKLRRKDGTLVTVLDSACTVRLNDEMCILSVAHVVQQAVAEKALQEANVRLQKSLEELKLTQQKMIQQERLSALGQMASGIAHDFNNVLMPIIGFSELLLADSAILDDRKELRRTINMILSAGQDARKIVSRLRAIYRGDEDDTDYRMVEISRIVESAISLTMSKWKEEMSAKGVTIEIKTDFHPVPQIKGNESEIREALTNLIFNAVDAMPKGGVITFRSFRKEEESIVLEMTDTGFGMEEKTLRRCLEPFFTTKGIHGSGLGLAMVYGIVKRHGGTVEIESKLGVGTTIRMLFPVPVNVDNTNEELKDKLEPHSPIRILVIDDEERSRALVARLLKADGHHVELAERGRPGLDMLRKAKYDLVITDRAMPEISGDQVAREAQEIQPGIPVIMLTGFGDIMKDRGEHPSGVNRVMSKPVMQQELRRVMASVMKNTGNSDNQIVSLNCDV